MLWKRLGKALFYKGATGRILLNVIVNLLNQLLLTKAWLGVEVKEKQPVDLRQVDTDLPSALEEGPCRSKEECIAKCGQPKCVPPAA